MKTLTHTIRVLVISFIGIAVTNGLESVCAQETAAPPAEIATAKATGMASDSKSWPLFRGDSRSRGVAVEPLPENLEVIWKRKGEHAFEGTAAIADGVVYIGDFEGHLYALDLETGEEKWKTKLCELGFASSAAVSNNRVYVGDFDGVFFCVNAADGKLEWKIESEAEINSSPNFMGDKVVFGSQDFSLYCLEAESGKQVWKYATQDAIQGSPSIAGTRTFVAGCDAQLHQIDLIKGESAGKPVDLDGPTIATPAVNGDRVYFGTENGTFYAIDWRKSEVVWQFQDENSGLAFRSSAAVTDDFVVVGGRSKRVYGLNAADGTKAWEFVTKRRVDSSPVIAGERVYVGSDDGRLYCLDLKTGNKIWEYETGGRLSASPSVAAGKLIIANDDGVVYCFGKK